MRHAIIAAVALTLALPGAGLAGKKGKGKKDHGDKRDADVEVTVQFGSRDRELVREYFVEKHGRGKCPPGRQAKKRYVVGQPLPSTVVIRELPSEISVRIGTAPHGYRYGIVDGDIVKLAIGTALVVDAIDGLVN